MNFCKNELFVCVVQTALHVAAGSVCGATCLEILLSEGADLNATVCHSLPHHTINQT